MASASSPATSADRSADRGPPAAPRAPSALSVDCRSTPRACSTGTRPKSSPAASDTPSVTESTRRSIVALISRGTLAGALATRSRTPAKASAIPTRRRGRREHDPFRDELAGDARRRRAECAPHRDFLRPGRPACDEQPGDVHARNQQDERDRANEHIQRRPHAPQHDVGERFDEHTAAAVRGISAFQRRRNRPELALGRFRRLTRREPAEHEDRMGLARQRLRIGAQRDPDVDARGLAAIREAARIGRRRQELQRPEVAGIGHDADDGVRPFVEAEDAADRGGGAAGGLPRERLADDRGIARADRIFLGGEPAAGNLTDAQHREQFRGTRGALRPGTARRRPARD